ncbi:MAG: dTDP-4-dehydrorhamnose reductase [Acidobacteria bacterium]|nr:dTDP-4-dehydrorhamnose reductase [Acidobacteriota bacterium]
MRTLVTGAGGMLGHDLMRVLPPDQTLGLSARQLDVTDGEAVRRKFGELTPELVIHAAAYTRVDECELHPETAFRVNGLGSRNVARAAEEVGARLIFVSTDYVFDGNQEEPYTEFDPVRPINVYGKSKLAGELYVREFCRDHCIVRTSWLFGKHGKNFVSTILQMAREREEISVVSDQVGSPTYTLHLAQKIAEIGASGRAGVYHVTGSKICSWFGFAEAILRHAHSRVRVVPILSQDYSSAAPRPKNSVLRNFVLELEGATLLAPWQQGLAEYFAESCE